MSLVRGELVEEGGLIVALDSCEDTVTVGDCDVVGRGGWENCEGVTW